ncbi:MAG: HAMP domain-containing sensor histidine kinase [Gammaproteobacteria bacterium]
MTPDFVEQLVHEVRTPLNTIMGWVMLMKKQQPDPARLAEGLAVIERSARAQARLLTDFADLNALRRGTLCLVPAQVDIAEVLKTAVSTALPDTAARDCLDLELHDAPLIVQGDRERLVQVVGIMLQLSARGAPPDGRIHISAARPGRGGHAGVRIEIAMRTSWPGLAASELGDTRLRSGSSLDFALARLLAASHGGELLATQAGAGGGLALTLTLHAPTA